MEKKSSNNNERESKSSKAGLTFPVSRFQRNLRKGNYADRIGTAGAVYLTEVLEYLTAEILELAGVACRDHNRLRIVPRHIMLAIKNDAELDELLRHAFFSGSGVIPNINPLLIKKSKEKTKKGGMSESASVKPAMEAMESDGDDTDGDESVDEPDGESGESEEEDEEDETVAASQNY